MDLTSVIEALGYFNMGVYVVIAIASVWHWRSRPNVPGAWMAATFCVLAFVSVFGLVIPEEQTATRDLLTKIDIAILLLFPYFLYRFSATFYGVIPPLRILATGMTAIMIVWTFLLGSFPKQGEPTPSYLRPYILALLVDWVALSTIMSIRLWRGGTGQPLLARRRMRLMSIAAALLSLGVVLSGAAGGDQPDAVRLVIQLIGLVAVASLFFGFSPPEFLRASWRRPAQEGMRRAMSSLLTAESESEVTTGLLPHVLGIVGARGVAFINENGRVVAMNNATSDMLESVPQLLARPETDEITEEMVFRFPFGALVVWASPFAPFFGTEESEIIQSIGALAHLALERTHASALKLQLSEARLRRKQALQLNDDVVQGLAVAKYAFELGEDEKGKASVATTLEAAKRIISDLLGEIEPDETMRAGTLIRDKPAATSREESA